MLQTKPMMQLAEGQVIKIAETRTWRSAATRLVDTVKSLGPLEKLAGLHANRAEEAERLLAQLKDSVSGERLIVDVATVIGTHVGPGYAAGQRERA